MLSFLGNIVWILFIPKTDHKVNIYYTTHLKLVRFLNVSIQRTFTHLTGRCSCIIQESMWTLEIHQENVHYVSIQLGGTV